MLVGFDDGSDDRRGDVHDGGRSGEHGRVVRREMAKRIYTAEYTVHRRWSYGRLWGLQRRWQKGWFTARPATIVHPPDLAL